MEEEVTMYVTKYALSTGILVKKGVISKEGYFSVKGDYSFYTPNEFFHTQRVAIKDAKARQKKKIKSLEKQLLKLRSLTFIN